LRGYRPQLDSLRAFAVAAVLASHFWLPDLQLASLGVRLFFVLSGFLLTSILLRERCASEENYLPRRKVLFDFYVRRILRIWPAYYFALIAAMILGAGSIAGTFAWHAFFASNILFFREQRWFPITAHLWTLSVEEQFYLLLPLLILFVSRRLLRPIVIASIAVAIAYRLAVARNVPSPTFYFVLPIAQLDALGAGTLLAMIQQSDYHLNWRRLFVWSLPVAALFTIGVIPGNVPSALGQSICLLPMVALVSGAGTQMEGLAGRVLKARPIVALGRISYGIYLYHLFVAAAFDKLADFLGLPHVPDGPYRFLLFFCATVTVAAFSWLIIEWPALSLRRQFRRATTAIAIIRPAPS